MLPLLIIGLAAYYSWDEVKKDFRSWGSRKLDGTRSAIAAKRAAVFARRSPRGRVRVRDVPLRWLFGGLDVVTSFGRAVKRGAKRGVEEGRQRYAVRQVWDEAWAENKRRDEDPNDVANCPVCKGAGVVDGDVCPRCLSRQQERNREHEASTPCPRCGKVTAFYAGQRGLCGMCQVDDLAARPDELAKRRELRTDDPTDQEDKPVAERVQGEINQMSNRTNEGDAMAVSEANGFEALKAGNAQFVEAANLEFEDAQTDLKRAEQNLCTLQSWAESVRAYWNEQTARPYLARIEAQQATVNAKRANLASMDAAKAAMVQATAEVDKAANLHEASRVAGFKDAQDGGRAAVGARSSAYA